MHASTICIKYIGGHVLLILRFANTTMVQLSKYSDSHGRFNTSSVGATVCRICEPEYMQQGRIFIAFFSDKLRGTATVNLRNNTWHKMAYYVVKTAYIKFDNYVVKLKPIMQNYAVEFIINI